MKEEVRLGERSKSVERIKRKESEKWCNQVSIIKIIGLILN